MKFFHNFFITHTQMGLQIWREGGERDIEGGKNKEWRFLTICQLLVAEEQALFQCWDLLRSSNRAFDVLDEALLVDLELEL